MSRMLNANQPHPRRCHYFDPSFSVHTFRDLFITLRKSKLYSFMLLLTNPQLEQVVLASLLPKAKKEEILDRSCTFLQADIVGHDVASCEMVH